jgi:hypothetical protein
MSAASHGNYILKVSLAITLTLGNKANTTPSTIHTKGPVHCWRTDHIAPITNNLTVQVLLELNAPHYRRPSSAGTPDDPIPTLDQTENPHDVLTTARTRTTTMKTNVLYCIALYCIVLYCIVLYCIVLYCIIYQ